MEIGSIGGSFAVEVVGLEITTDDPARHADELRAALDEPGRRPPHGRGRRRLHSIRAGVRRTAALDGHLRDPHSGKDDRLVDIPNVAENGEIAAADSTQRTIMVGARSGSPRATPDTRRSTAAASASRRAPHRGGGRWQWPGSLLATSTRAMQLLHVHDADHARRLRVLREGRGRSVHRLRRAWLRRCPANEYRLGSAVFVLPVGNDTACRGGRANSRPGGRASGPEALLPPGQR
jgi:hypothetical protein